MTPLELLEAQHAFVQRAETDGGFRRYVKGPEDRPSKQTEKVYDLSR